MTLNCHFFVLKDISNPHFLEKYNFKVNALQGKFIGLLNHFFSSNFKPAAVAYWRSHCVQYVYCVKTSANSEMDTEQSGCNMSG